MMLINFAPYEYFALASSAALAGANGWPFELDWLIRELMQQKTLSASWLSAADLLWERR